MKWLFEKVARGYEEQVDQLTQIIILVKDISYSKNGTTLSSHNELNNLLDTLLSRTKEGRKEVEREQTIVKEKRIEYETQECPCVHSDWTEWAECSVSCGGGTKSRTRTIDQPALNHGTCDGDLTEEQNCNENPCRKH